MDILEKVGLSREFLRPSTLLAFLLASGPIASVLVYFAGWMSMPAAAGTLFLPGVLLSAGVGCWARLTRRDALTRRLASGLWSGSFATLAYDAVRLPLAHAGVPVFKAISYFGTTILSLPRPTLTSEILGWSYHFATGVGFATMYCLLVRRPRSLTAVAWGVALEVLMLLTPYAEVFGYARSRTFVAASLSAHVVYGVALYVAACHGPVWEVKAPPRPEDGWRLSPGHTLAWLCGPLVVALIAADFHRLHAATIPASPPADIGPGLYVTWNVPEPDRIGAIWLIHRFVDPGARFHFVEPMSVIRFGRPFDIPEADIRRSINRSAFEAALEQEGRVEDPDLQPLRQLCYMTEIRPWALASDPETQRRAADLAARLGDCRTLPACLDPGLAWFEETYRSIQSPSR
jgi:hypothetical protein